MDNWFLVRLDECGFPGRQHNIRATGNSRFRPEQMCGDEDDLRAAYSFLTLAAAYRGLDANAAYRVRVCYGTTKDRPRIQSLHAGGATVHPPMRLPEGRTESWTFDVPVSPDSSGCLTLTFEAHELPENAGRTDVVADTATVTRIELFADAAPPRAVIDAATVPDGGVVVSLLSLPELIGMPDRAVTVTFPDGTRDELVTDSHGDAITVNPVRTASLVPGSDISVETSIDGECFVSIVQIDEAFGSTWPTLTPALSAKSQTISLDGVWDFSTAAGHWSPIEVPGQWFQQGFDVPADGRAKYRTRFPRPRHDGVVILRFDAVYSHAEVFLNGVLLGDHEGGFTPFQFDVSDHLHANNELVVVSRSNSASDVVSAASDYAGHPLGGITRSVSVLLFPHAHLSRLHMDSSFQSGVGGARVFGEAVLATEHGVVDIRIAQLDGTVLAENRVPVTREGSRFEYTFSVADALPWTAESPQLYEMSARLNHGPWVKRHFGFRTVEVVNTQLHVNGSPILLRGVERHEQDPIRGRSTQADNWHRDIDLMKGANVNNVFTCHYPHAEGFLDLCDQRGLWVIDESPTVWVDQSNADDPEQFLTIAMPILEMIERDYSRPAVVVWMLGDECLWGRNFWRLVAWLRHQGVHIPMMFSFDIGGRSSLNIASRHYPPMNFGPEIEEIDRPVTFDQFAHVNCYNRRELVTDPELRDWWGATFAPMWHSMLRDHRVLGGQIWAWSDDEFHLDDGRFIGYGAWGIVDAWRRPKPEWWNLKMIYSPVQVEEFMLGQGARGEIEIPLRNHFDFLSLEMVTLRWSTPTESGQTTCSGPPRSSGRATVTLTDPLELGDQLCLRFFSQDDELIVEVAVTAGQEAPDVDKEKLTPTTSATTTVRERRSHLSAPNKPEFDAYRLSAGPIEWLCDEETGILRAGRLGRRTIVEEAPQLMLLRGDATKTVGPHHRPGIAPLTDTCRNRQMISVEWNEGERMMTTAVSYDEASFEYLLRFDDDGALEVKYSVTPRRPIEVRQLGIVFDLPSTFNTLRWSRKALWSVYPVDHIGRPSGVARASAAHARRSWRGTSPIAPDWPWSLDENALGTADFRSTRRGIHWASLTDHSGAGIWVDASEQTDVRTWRAGDRTRLLIARHSSGGSEPFLSHTGQLDSARLFLDAGQTVLGSARVSLARWEAAPSAGERGSGLEHVSNL